MATGELNAHALSDYDKAEEYRTSIEMRVMETLPFLFLAPELQSGIRQIVGCAWEFFIVTVGSRKHPIRFVV